MRRIRIARAAKKRIKEGIRMSIKRHNCISFGPYLSSAKHGIGSLAVNSGFGIVLGDGARSLGGGGFGMFSN
jgi:hypothetical protein